jgi:hypothetical protein
MNIEQVRAVVNFIDWEMRNGFPDDIKILREFIDEVEELLKHNSIKQTPALLKAKK